MYATAHATQENVQPFQSTPYNPIYNLTQHSIGGCNAAVHRQQYKPKGTLTMQLSSTVHAQVKSKASDSRWSDTQGLLQW